MKISGCFKGGLTQYSYSVPNKVLSNECTVYMHICICLKTSIENAALCHAFNFLSFLFLLSFAKVSITIDTISNNCGKKKWCFNRRYKILGKI